MYLEKNTVWKSYLVELKSPCLKSFAAQQAAKSPTWWLFLMFFCVSGWLHFFSQYSWFPPLIISFSAVRREFSAESSASSLKKADGHMVNVPVVTFLLWNEFHDFWEHHPPIVYVFLRDNEVVSLDLKWDLKGRNLKWCYFWDCQLFIFQG